MKRPKRIAGLMVAIAGFVTACGGAEIQTQVPIATNALECFESRSLAEKERPLGGRTLLPPEVDLSGTWLQVDRRTSVTSPPIIDDVISETTLVTLVEIVQNESDIVVTAEGCVFFTESDNDSAQTTIPEAWVESMPVIIRSGTAVQPPDSPGRAWIFLPDQAHVRGALLADPSADALPREADDPRVLDPDEDGNPGMTLEISGFASGEMYVVQRTRSAMCGGGDANGVSGQIEWTIEQVVLDASSFMLDRQTDTAPHPDPTRHRFEAVRLNSPMTCEMIRDRWEALIGQEEQVQVHH